MVRNVLKFFNVFFLFTVKKTNEKTPGRGVKRGDERGRDGGCGLKLVRHAWNTVLIAESREVLVYIIDKFGRVCDRMSLWKT